MSLAIVLGGALLRISLMGLLLFARVRYLMLSSCMYVIVDVPESGVSMALGAFLGGRRQDLMAFLCSFYSLRLFVLDLLSSS